MTMSGSIRRTERKTGQPVASRKAPPRFASPRRTTYSGPGVFHFGPGFFLPVNPPKLFSMLPKSVLSQCTLMSYFMPLERKSRLGAMRSHCHE